MKKWFGLMLVGALSLGFSFSASAQDKKKIVIGLVAKSQSNPVFQAAYSGAKDAAKELGAKYGVEVVIDWQTPPNEDAQKQAQAIEQLANGGAAGIAVSASDANTVTPAIDKAIEMGIPVICFDSDAPKSKRLACYGTDDESLGHRLVQYLAKSMNEKGTIAILSGNQSAPNLQRRVNGAKEELAKYPNMKLLDDGVFYAVETPEDAAKTLVTAQSTHPEIEGWCFIGGWPLFTKNACKWNPGEVKAVSCDALPPQLGYLESGHVDVLLAQDCYGWGHKSVEILLAKIIDNKDPESVKIVDPLKVVTKENAPEVAKMWDKWLGK
jgi:ribose transport system substrate-binding protein